MTYFYVSFGQIESISLNCLEKCLKLMDCTERGYALGIERCDI